MVIGGVVIGGVVIGGVVIGKLVIGKLFIRHSLGEGGVSGVLVSKV